jgi:hypothetical protein
MMKNHLLLLIALFAALTGYALTGRAQTDNTRLPELKGEWKLDSIVKKQGENKITALSPGKIIPDSIYYSCPVKIRFDERTEDCQFLYENKETKDLFAYVYEKQNGIRLLCSSPNQIPVNEWTFDYLLEAEQDSLILYIEYNAESSDTKIIYEYFYSLSK